MKVAFIADVHLANHRKFNNFDVALKIHDGLNTRCEIAIDVLSAALERAKLEGCSHVYVVGDLFESVKPEPQIVARVMQVFEEKSSDKFKIHVMTGNHDQVEHENDNHALGPLRFLSHVSIYNDAGVHRLPGSKLEQIEIWRVPFRSGKASDWLPEILKELKKKASGDVPRFLTMHLGISEIDMPTWQRSLQDCISSTQLGSLCSEHNIRAVFAGHWHKHRIWCDRDLGTNEELKYVQLGTLTPADWRDMSNELVYATVGVMTILECVSLTEWSIKSFELPGPRFIECDASDESLQLLKTFSGSHYVFARMIATEKNGGVQGAQAWLEERRSEGLIKGFEVLPDDHAALVAGRTAASFARSEDNLAKALSSFVSQIPLEDGVDRARVLEKARQLLRL